MSKIKIEDIKKVFPSMKFIALAVGDIDLSDDSAENTNKEVRTFVGSTLTTKSDLVQAAIILAKDTELRETLQLILSLTEEMLKNSEIQEHLKNVLFE